jgi:hypothetical protein
MRSHIITSQYLDDRVDISNGLVAIARNYGRQEIAPTDNPKTHGSVPKVTSLEKSHIQVELNLITAATNNY